MMPVGNSRHRVQRRTQGSYVDGVYEDGEEKTFTISASVQPATAKILEDYGSEGLEASDSVAVYTKADLKTVQSSKMPDRIEYEGNWYEVQEDKHVSRHAPIPRSRTYIATREEK